MTADGPKASGYGTKSAHRRRRRAYGVAVRGFSVVFVVLGLVTLVSTIVNGGGPLSVGVLIGIAFVAVGAGRLWVSARMSL